MREGSGAGPGRDGDRGEEASERAREEGGADGTRGHRRHRHRHDVGQGRRGRRRRAGRGQQPGRPRAAVLPRRGAGPSGRRGVARRGARGADPAAGRRGPDDARHPGGRTWRPWCRRCARSTATGRPISDGMLYGDERGAGVGDAADGPSESGELVRFLAWLVGHHPDAAGYWPAQAVANAALSGVGAIDTVVASRPAAVRLDGLGRGGRRRGRPRRRRSAAGDRARVPIRSARWTAAGGALLGGGTIDALGEQLVAGADGEGDVLVILGSTLIVWAVAPSGARSTASGPCPTRRRARC